MQEFELLTKEASLGKEASLENETCLENEIRNVYIGDLLSWVMGNAKEGSAWVTIQGHINIIAVASLISASCIIIAENAEIFDDALEKAIDERIPVFKTKLNSFEVAKVFASRV